MEGLHEPAQRIHGVILHVVNGIQDTIILCVVAHPDDEVLGFGGTASRLAARGTPTHVCVLVGDAEARNLRPAVDDLHADVQAAAGDLGFKSTTLGSFPNIALNTVDHLDVVRFIEGAMQETGATVIFTHHPGDLNVDHRVTGHAAEAAARLAQRGGDVPPLRGLFHMEIPSATDWAFSGSAPFDPQAYFEIGEEGLEAKLAALARYRGVMRPYPHARSAETIRALAVLRGSESGLNLAEAFHVGFLNAPDAP